MGPEARIEKAVCDYAKAKGCLVYKFTSPENRSVPDRLFIFNGEVWFIEFKAPGKRLTPMQARECSRIHEQQVCLHICDSIEKGKAAVNAHT